MMTKSKKIKIIALVMALFLAVTAIVTTLILTSNKSTTVQAATVDGWNTKEPISVGSPVVIPETAKVIIDGAEATVDNKYIVYPNGTVKTYGDYPLGMVGEYTMLFKGTHNGSEFIAEQKFFVVNDAYMFSNSESSVTYTKLDDLANENVYEMKKDGEGNYTILSDKGNKKDLLSAQGVKDGVISASLEQNDALRIDKVANIYDIADEEGNVDICSFLPGNYTPVDEKNQVNNNVDTCYSLVKVVDCYDPTNYIEYYIWTGSFGSVNYNDYYVGAGASNQDLKGLSGPVSSNSVNSNNYAFVDDDAYRIYTVDRYTTGYAHGAYAGGVLYRSGLYTKNMMNLAFNVYSNRCYINDVLINDLDENALYPNANEKFKGFTTGEVYIQFEHAYSFAYIINFEIASVLDKSGEELKNNGIDDQTPPVINLDIEKTTDTGIFISKGKEFTLPKAQVLDVNGTGDYSVELYYNFSTDNQITVSLSNGKFTPSNIGVYTAFYTATDKYGNLSVETLRLISYDGETITYDNNNVVGALEAGKANTIPTLNPVTINKNVKEQVAIIYPDGTKVDFTNSKTSSGYSIIPEYVGICKIEYTFTDSVSSAVFSYDVNSSGENVYFKDALAIPTYMIQDAYYDLDKYFVYVPSATGLNPLQAEIYYSVDGGAEVKIENQHKFLVPTGDNIKFRAKYGEQYSSEYYFAKLVDLGFAAEKKDYKNYWQGYKTVVAESNAMNYTMQSKSTLSFVTPIALGAFAVNYKVEDSANLNAYSIKISGIANKDEGLKITYERVPNNSKQLIYTVENFNGKVYYKGEVIGNFADEKNLTVTGDYYLKSGENVSVKLPEFKSRNVEFKFDFTDATGEFVVSISKVCNQAFNSSMKKRDEAKAKVVYKKIFKEYFKGDECYLPSFYVSSALYPTSLNNLKISISNTSSKTFAKDKNGNEIKNLVMEYGKEYSFMIEDVASYLATFAYDDFYDDAKKDNITVVDGSYNVKSKDNQKPTVSFAAYEGEGREVVALNTKYAFRTCTVADDVTAANELYLAYSVYNYKGDLEYWDLEPSFTFTEAGVYTISVFCQDSDKNFATASYEIEVK